MNCELCEGTNRVARIRNGSRVDTVTCPRCIRGMVTLGAHEMLRGKGQTVHMPGERIDGTTGTFLTGVIESSSA